MFESDSKDECEVPMTRVSDALRATGADKYCSDDMDDDEHGVEESKLIELNNLIQQIKLTNTPDSVDATRDLKEGGHKKQMLGRCEQTDQPWQISPPQKQVEAQFDHENIGVNGKYLSGPDNLKDTEVENLLLIQSRIEDDAMTLELNKIKEENALIKFEMEEIKFEKEEIIISIKEELAKDLDYKSELERKVFKLEEEMKVIRRQSEDKNEQLMKLGRNFMEVLTLAENENSSNNEENAESNRQKSYGLSNGRHSQNSPRDEKFCNPEENCQLFVLGVDEHIKRHEMLAEFGKHGTVTDAYNTGNGYAFITYSSPAEAQDCLRSMNGSSVFGQTVQIKPKTKKSKPDQGRCKDGHEVTDVHFRRKDEGEGRAYNHRISKLPPRLAKQREITRAAARGNGGASPSNTKRERHC